MARNVRRHFDARRRVYGARTSYEKRRAVVSVDRSRVCAERLERREKIPDRAFPHSFFAVDSIFAVGRERERRGEKTRRRPAIPDVELRVLDGEPLSVDSVDVDAFRLRVEGRVHPQSAERVEHETRVFRVERACQRRMPLRERR